MRKITTILTVLSVIAIGLLSLFSSGTGYLAPPQGQVYALQLGSTLYGINQAINEAPGTVLLLHEQSQLVALGWSVKDAFAFACASYNGVSCAQDLARLFQKGNVVNPNDVQGMLTFLQRHGWKVVTAAELPAAFKIAVAGATYAMVVAQSEVVLILAFPVFDMDFLHEKYGLGGT